MSKYVRAVCKYSCIPCLAFLYVSVLLILCTIASDKWRMMKIEYKLLGVEGSSETYIGGFDLKRFNYATIGNATLSFTNSLSYKSILQENYCKVPVPASSSDSYPLRIDVFRRIDQVGLLDGAKEVEFIEKHGRPIYDVLCSGIADFQKSGKVIMSIALATMLLIFPILIACVIRCNYNKRSTTMDSFRIYEIISIIIWVATFSMGIISSLYYIYGANYAHCVDINGDLTTCPLALSSKVFLIASVFSMVSFICYLLYGKSLKDGVFVEPLRFGRVTRST
uniref:Uncharacterized protein n=1 Tax=Babesia bovis TaxID=5865 RepID=S6B2C1_BABBO|nr:hypothetical protein [Babesia bovis]